jgi:hypothetical protein
MCQPKQTLPFHLQHKLANVRRLVLSSHLLGCLGRSMNYGPWPVTFLFNCFTKYYPDNDPSGSKLVATINNTNIQLL